MSKERKKLYYLTVPMFSMALILFLILIFIKILGSYESDWIWFKILIISSGTLLLLSALFTLIFLPIVRKKENKDYASDVSLDFDDLTIEKINNHFMILGYNEKVMFKEKELLFEHTKKTVKYSDVKMKIVHKNSFGKKENFVQIILPKTLEKMFGRHLYLDYSKPLMFMIRHYGLEVLDLECLAPNYVEPVWNMDEKVVFAPSIKKLLFKIAITIICLCLAVVLMIQFDKVLYTYLCFIPPMFLWLRSDKMGKLIFTKDGVINKKLGITIKIPYSEILNVSFNNNAMIITSMFQYIRYEKRDDVIMELKKHIKL